MMIAIKFHLICLDQARGCKALQNLPVTIFTAPVKAVIITPGNLYNASGANKLIEAKWEPTSGKF